MSILSWLGFALATVVYLLTLFLVSTTKSKSSSYYALIYALIGGTFWSATMLLSRISIVYDTYIFIAESIRLLSIVTFMHFVVSTKTKSLRQLLSSPSLIIVTLVAIIVPVINQQVILPKPTVFIGYLSLTIVALVYLEMLFKHAKQHLWQLKPLLLSLALLLFFDFIIFADATLLQNVDQDMWVARGYLHAIFIPLLVLSVKRTQDLGIRVFISRDMVFQSSLLMVSGLYLIIMAVAAYYIKSIEAQWSNLAQIIFLVLAFAFLIALFISDGAKRNFKVFIQKNFFANRFDYREKWLQLTRLVSEPLATDETVYQRAVRGFCQSVSYDKGVILKLKSNNFEQLGSFNMALNAQDKQTLCDILIPYVIQKNWLIDIKEYKTSVQNYPGLIIPYSQAQQLNFQIIVPIKNGESLWGVVLIDNSSEQVQFNWEMRDYMQVVSMQLGSYLLQSEANKTLTENAQFAAFSRTSAFVVHDLKNVLAQIRLIVSNSEKFKHNPEFIEDTFETLSHTDARMQKMLNQLLSKRLNEQAEQMTSITNILNKDILPKCQNLRPLPSVTVNSDFSLNVDNERFSSILYHLIDNAQHATDDAGDVSININSDTSIGTITISDSGCGMSQDFIQNKLFRPFETTKGNAGMGIGAYDAKLYIENLGGNLTVTSEIRKGSEFIISLPLNNS